MLISRLMDKPPNDNSDPWQPISRVNERLVEHLEEKPIQEVDRDETERAEAHRRYVEQRIRETLMWERRINPKD